VLAETQATDNKAAGRRPTRDPLGRAKSLAPAPPPGVPPPHARVNYAEAARAMLPLRRARSAPTSDPLEGNRDFVFANPLLQKGSKDPEMRLSEAAAVPAATVPSAVPQVITSPKAGPAAPHGAATLPSGWEEQVSSSGRLFYRNRKEGVKTFTHPGFSAVTVEGRTQRTPSAPTLQTGHESALPTHPAEPAPKLMGRAKSPLTAAAVAATPAGRSASAASSTFVNPLLAAAKSTSAASVGAAATDVALVNTLPLPKGWETAVSSSGKVFYRNREAGLKTLEHPSEEARRREIGAAPGGPTGP
jgi:hypothetical protein